MQRRDSRRKYRRFDLAARAGYAAWQRRRHGHRAKFATVQVVRWEIVVEPNEDELPGGELPEDLAFGVFTVQLPAGDDWMSEMSVVVPPEYVEAYLGEEVNKFKYEVGAKEESGNQTFTEEEFEIEIP